MKLATKKIASLFSILFAVILFASCKKENAQPVPVQITEPGIDDTVSVSSSTDIDGLTKLILRPCDHDGQDTYVCFLNGNPDWANSTGDWAQELSMCSWTNSGLPMTVRSFIRFPGISRLPAGAQIVSANLFLYGKGSSISAPQGNSAYPGSPYNTDNSCKVERVTGKQWKENTITWNTQPAVTTQDASVIPPSNSQWSYNAKVDVTNMVKAMAADLTKNYGFRISLVNETIYRSLIFASSENKNPALRPKLVIRYQ